MAFASLADLVKNFESGGNYTALQGQGLSSASGAYQFTDPTWRAYASQIGVDTSLYPRAYMAPPATQDAVFGQAVSQRGLGDWTCPGCNPKLSSYIASTPGATDVPTFSSGSSLTALASGGGGVQAPTYDPQRGWVQGTSPDALKVPSDVGSSSTNTGGSAASDVADKAGAVFTWLLSSRFSLFVLAVIFIGGGIFLLALKSGMDIRTGKLA